MPTTPDPAAPGAGRPADPVDAYAADAVELVARETVPIDVRPRVPDGSAQLTVRIDPRRPGATDVGDRKTVALPGSARRPSVRRRAPLVAAAGFATLWAGLLSYLPVALIIWVARWFAGVGVVGSSARTSLAAWLLGHGVPLGTPIGPIGVAPLLFSVLIGWRLHRAGVHVTRAIGARNSGSLRAAGAAAASVGIGYAVLGVLAALAMADPQVSVSVPRAGLTLGVAGALFAFLGALHNTGAVVVVARRVPPVVRHGVRTGVVAVLLILAAGAGFTGLSVAVGGSHAAEMIGAYRTGVAGQAGITLVSLVYGANATVWAVAYLLGPGFLLGTGTVVRLTDVEVGPLPALPLFAGLPEGPVGAAGAGLLAFPMLAGMSAGWMLTRRLIRARRNAARQQPMRPGSPHTATVSTGPTWSSVIGSALLAGPVAGALLGLLAVVSGGPLGAGRLVRIGPVPWQVALVATAVVSASALLGAVVSRAYRPHPAQ